MSTGPSDTSTAAGSWPRVTMILPVLDEMTHIAGTMADLLGQDYPGPYDMIVADGGSTDGTFEYLQQLAAGDARLTVIINPRRRQAYGLNEAAVQADGEILVRADGHSRYASDYLRRSVEAVIELRGAVGGRMNPEGYDDFSRAVAAAMNSKLSMGPGRFHHAEGREQVDTVYLGAFPRDAFLEVGGIRAFPSGSSEDADFYYRWRLSGRPVFVDPAIRSSYAPRNRVSDLWRQYWRYGQGKSEMLWVNGRFPSWRPLAPLALVAALILGLGLGVGTRSWLFFSAVMISWVALLGVVGLSNGKQVGSVMMAAATMHIAYGFGGLWGLIRGPGPLRHLKQ